jgi:acetolactate synthase I/II/III large subunit
VLNLGFGSMGHGTVAPIGAALAHPDRPVFAIVGDACFAMNGMELLTAVEYDIPVIWIVENNQMHGITWHGSKAATGTEMAAVVNRKRVHVAAIAAAMGLEATRVECLEDVGNAVDQALRMGRPAMIEVMTDATISPPVGDRVKTVNAEKNLADVPPARAVFKQPAVALVEHRP